MKNFFKRSLLALSPFVGVSAFAADGGAGSSYIDTTALTTAASTMQTEMTTFATSLTPILLAIAGAFLALSLIMVVVRWIRRVGK